MLVDVALHEDGCNLGVETDGEKHCRKFESLFADDSGTVENGECVEIDDAVVHVPVVLAGDPVDEGAEVVSEVNGTGGLDAGEHAGHVQTLVGTGSAATPKCTGPGVVNYSCGVAIDVALPAYEGPFDLLLHLILKEEVDIHEISLSTIVDAYLKELARMTELDLEVATEFLLIAATLVELKARRLLPGKETVDLDEELALWEERDLLLARLLECKTFKDVAQVLARFVDDADRVYPRLAGADERFANVMPDLLEGMTVAKLQRGFISAITPKAEPSISLYHVSPIRFTVAEAVEELMDELPRMGRTSFKSLTHGLIERLEIVVRFLALLEMYKQGWIEIDQGDRFGDIAVEWTGAGPESGGDYTVDDYDG